MAPSIEKDDFPTYTIHHSGLLVNRSSEKAVG